MNASSCDPASVVVHAWYLKGYLGIVEYLKVLKVKATRNLPVYPWWCQRVESENLPSSHARAPEHIIIASSRK